MRLKQSRLATALASPSRCPASTTGRIVERASRSRCSLIATVVSLTTVVACCSSLRGPESTTRDELLRATQIGTAADRVQSVIKERYAERCRWWDAKDLHSLEIAKNHPLYSSHSARTQMRVCIGQYWPSLYGGPFTTSVFAWWYFDAEGDLVEIRVEKDRDMP